MSDNDNRVKIYLGRQYNHFSFTTRNIAANFYGVIYNFKKIKIKRIKVSEKDQSFKIIKAIVHTAFFLKSKMLVIKQSGPFLEEMMITLYNSRCVWLWVK